MVGAVSHYTNCGNAFTAAFLYDIIIIERRVITLATIQAKKRPVIKKGNGYVYNPQTFAKEHKVSNFHVVDDPQELLSLV